MLNKTIAVALFFGLIGCNSENTVSYSKPETTLDVARLFIELTQSGQYDEAKSMILSSPTNDSIIVMLKQGYQSLSNGQKQDLKMASINIHNIEELNEKESQIIYSNTYDKKVHKLRVVKINDKWLIDIVHTFNGNL